MFNRSLFTLTRNQRGPKISFLLVLVVFYLLSMTGCSKTDQLISRLGSEESNVQAKAIDSLVQMGEAAVDPLIKALSHKNSKIQIGAALALGKIGNKRALEPLLAMLGNDNYSLAGAAALALGYLKDHRAIKPLSETLLGSSVWNSSIKDEAALALAKIGDPKSIDDLIQAIKKDSNCEKCYEALSEFGEVAATKLVSELKPFVIDVGSGDSQTAFLELVLYSPLTEPIIAALVRIGEPALGSLFTGLKVKDSPTTRGKAAMTLGIIKNNRAIEPLVRAIKNEYKDGSVEIQTPYVVTHGTLALSNIGSPEAFKALIQLMTDNVELVRSLSQTGIISIRPRKKAIENLIISLRDQDFAVRSKVAQTLTKLTGVNIGPSQEKWITWWQQNSDKIAKEDQESATVALPGK